MRRLSEGYVVSPLNTYVKTSFNVVSANVVIGPTQVVFS
jgi:hypothetical protein